MGDGTGIEWTDATWNPVVGCSKVSPGCDRCYAIGQAHRNAAMDSESVYIGTTRREDDIGLDWTGVVKCLPERLDQPIRWKRPRRIFVNSMSDLFHPDVPTQFIARVWAVMAMADHHQFQVLTKRPQRMAALLGSPSWALSVGLAMSDLRDESEPFAKAMAARTLPFDWRAVGALVLHNVWLGTSIEADKFAFRADHLRKTPAAIRWVSAEPLLGPLPSLDVLGLDWIVVGGESGPGARPMHPLWARQLRDRCQTPPLADRVHAAFTAKVLDPMPKALLPRPAFLFKQWGQWRPTDLRWNEAITLRGATPEEGHRIKPGLAIVEPEWACGISHPGNVVMERVRSKHEGRGATGAHRAPARHKRVRDVRSADLSASAVAGVAAFAYAARVP